MSRRESNRGVGGRRPFTAQLRKGGAMRMQSGFWMMLIAGMMIGSGSMAQEKKQPDLTTQLAASDPDFKVQGEYEAKGAYGAQVVAKGNGKFEVYLLVGGLPGAGWD